MSQTFSLQKSRELLKEQGYDTWIVEKPYNPYTKRREDMFNFADLVAIRLDMPGVTAIQATGEDCSGHIKKMVDGYVSNKGRTIPPNLYLKTWLGSGNRFFIWSWILRGKKGRRKLYHLREIEFILENGQVVHRELPHVEETVSD
jgi:hypothetical protein